MLDFKRLITFSCLLMFSLPVLANKAIYVRKSVAFDAFPSDAYYVGETENIDGHHTSSSYPNPLPPTDPLHDDDQKFSMRCQSSDGGDVDCEAKVTVNVYWNQDDPSNQKSCTVVAKLTADGDVVFGYDTHRKYSISGDCGLDDKKIDGVGVWVVHPNTIIKKRTTSVTFKGRFSDTQASTWAGQIYENLNDNIKSLIKNYTPTYELSADRREVTFSIPSHYELDYTCQDWC